MRYFLSVIDHETGTMTDEERTAIEAFNAGLEADGHWVFGAGLAAPETATVVDNRGGQGLTTDGPFLESKEYLAGFWVFDAPDLDVALRLAADASKACNRRIEVRPFLRG